MKIRKFNTGDEFKDYPADPCAWCAAGHEVKWTEPGEVVFFENEAGEVRSVECFARIGTARPRWWVIGCKESTAEEARALIGLFGPS